MSQEKNPAPAKKAKRAFPIRVGVIVPLIATIAGIWFYFAVMFDGHMRWLLQKGLSYANGAEANVASFTTDFSEASMAIRGIQMTDEQHPLKTGCRLVRFATRWTGIGLLRAKFVVDDASVVGIGMNVPRKKPGNVFPKEPAPDDEGSKTMRSLLPPKITLKAGGRHLFRGSRQPEKWSRRKERSSMK